MNLVVSFMGEAGHHVLDSNDEILSPERDPLTSSNFRDRAFSWDCKYSGHSSVESCVPSGLREPDQLHGRESRQLLRGPEESK